MSLYSIPMTPEEFVDMSAVAQDRADAMDDVRRFAAILASDPSLAVEPRGADDARMRASVTFTRLHLAIEALAEIERVRRAVALGYI